VRVATLAVALAGCGRLGFDADHVADLDAGRDAMVTDGRGTMVTDGGLGASCTLPTTGSCGGTSPFTRVQFVPSNCAVGTTCMILKNVASQSQSITVTAGDLLVAFAYGGQNPGLSAGGTAPNMQFAVTDTLGNTFYPGPFVNNAKYDDSAIQVFFAPNARGGSDTVTNSSTAPQAENFWTGLVVVEYAGVATTNVVDLASSTAGPINSATASAPAMTVRTQCDLVVGGMQNGHVNASHDTPGAGWNMPVLDEWDPAGFVDNAATGASFGSTVGIAINQALGSDDGWAATQLAFRAASATAPCSPDGLAFATAPQTVAANTCSGPMTISSVAAGVSTTTPSGIEVSLTGASGTLFYADAACMFPIQQTVIGAGTSSATFYFKAPSATTTITVSAPGFASVGQTQI
jgi:hypothetical protein